MKKNAMPYGDAQIHCLGLTYKQLPVALLFRAFGIPEGGGQAPGGPAISRSAAPEASAPLRGGHCEGVGPRARGTEERGEPQDGFGVFSMSSLFMVSCMPRLIVRFGLCFPFIHFLYVNGEWYTE